VKRLLLVCGEASGEKYASLLIRELKKLDDIDFVGLGSHLLKDEIELLADYRDISVVGVKEAVPKLKRALEIYGKIKDVIDDMDGVILVDFPEFNFKVGKLAYKRKKKVVYYVAPQVWAWRSYRVRTMTKFCDKIITVFPFERAFYRNFPHHEKVFYFGHPILDVLDGKIGIHKKEDIVLLLPGSRKDEISYNLPIIFDAAKDLKKRLPKFTFVWATGGNVDVDFINTIKNKYPFVEVVEDTCRMMDISKIAIVASGTATLECAVFGLPMIIVYKISRLSYLLGRMLIRRVKDIGLPNIIAGKRIVPELIGGNATPSYIEELIVHILTNRSIYTSFKDRLSGVKSSLGKPGVSYSAASLIYNSFYS
jgi:lipid-A-disaccharide synthase